MTTCCAAGVIDVDYRGNVGVVLFNLSQKPYKGTRSAAGLIIAVVIVVSMATVQRGDRVAQLVLERILTPVVMETEVCGCSWSPVDL